MTVSFLYREPLYQEKRFYVKPGFFSSLFHVEILYVNIDIQ